MGEVWILNVIVVIPKGSNSQYYDIHVILFPSLHITESRVFVVSIIWASVISLSFISIS